MDLLYVFWKCDQICWLKNLHAATWTINLVDYIISCVNQIYFIVVPLNFFWDILIDNSW